MRNLVYKAGVLALFLSVLLMGCTQTAEPPAVEMTTIVDGLGRSVQLPAKVESAVSLAPNLTESVFAVGAGDRLVGVTTYCNYPESAKQIEKIGDTMSPNIESIIALRPQVVLVSTDSQLESFADTLAAHRIAVFVIAATDVNSVIESLVTLGRIFGTQQEAENTARRLRQRIDDVKRRTATETPVKVFVQISNEPLFTIGKGSFLNEVIESAGGVSVTRYVESAYPKLSKETAAAMDPEAIILSESDDNREPNVVFNNSSAVKSGRVYKIKADILSRPGPRIADAVEEMAKLLWR